MTISARAIASWSGQVIAWFVILGAIAVLAASVVVPRLGGATPYTVRSDSMEPTYSKGGLVVVKPAPIEEIGIGDVITFQIESGKPTVATHRVVGISTELGGDRYLVTQGDANDIADPEPVQPEQVKGKVWYSIPYVGYVNNVINGDARQLGLYGVVVALVGYAAVMFVGSVRDRRRRSPVEAGVPDEELHTTTV